MKKRLISLALALAVALTLCPPLNAQAANEDFEVVDGVLVQYHGEEENLVIPGDLGIKEIGSNAFLIGGFSNTTLKSVTVPEGVERLADEAFRNCMALKTVDLPASLRSMGNQAFVDADLEKIAFPAGLRYIGSNAFWFCESLEEVTWPAGCGDLYIGEDAFFGCTSLEKVVLPACGGNLFVDTFVFNDCSSLKTVEMPAGTGLAFFDNQAFDGAEALEEVSLPDNAIVYGINTFENTPFGKKLEASQEEFVMAGRTLLFYNGPGGDVVLPENCLTVGKAPTSLVDGDIVEGAQPFDRRAKEITGITFPAGLQEKLDAISALAENIDALINEEASEKPAFWSAPGVSQFSHCWATYRGWSRKLVNLTELKNHPNAEQVRAAQEFMAAHSVWANPADYFGTPSAAVQAKSNQIVAEAGAVTDYEKLKAIADWVAKNVKYDVEVANNVKDAAMAVTDPDAVLGGAPTICHGYTLLTRGLLWAQGIPAMYVHGDTPRGEHAWNEAFADGRWVILDTTWMAPFWNSTDEQKYDDEWFDVGAYWASGQHTITDRPHAGEENTPSTWAQKEIMAALGAKLVPNDLQKSYRSNITREEFCRLMVKLVEQRTGKAVLDYAASKGLTVTDPFTDTDNAAVLAAHALGIVNGTSATTFTPAGSLTRQEAAAMLTRTAKLLGLSAGQGETFADAATFPDWAKEGIAYVSGLTDGVSGSKVMGGTGNGAFSPAATYTREQALVTALRLFRVPQASEG